MNKREEGTVSFKTFSLLIRKHEILTCSITSWIIGWKQKRYPSQNKYFNFKVEGHMPANISPAEVAMWACCSGLWPSCGGRGHTVCIRSVCSWWWRCQRLLLCAESYGVPERSAHQKHIMKTQAKMQTQSDKENISYAAAFRKNVRDNN